ncbi:MAG: hypothetical protein EOO04_27120 [Chitinophagaceae bacterium]|nr:MAG: hypothetical protein EOO04_27120 [Chitinophagaceae bacterium]
MENGFDATTLYSLTRVLKKTTYKSGFTARRPVFCIFAVLTMRRLIIFIPPGESEPVSVAIQHQPELEVPGIWNISTNEVFLSTDLWNQFPKNDQLLQRRIFDQLIRVSNDLPAIDVNGPL